MDGSIILVVRSWIETVADPVVQERVLAITTAFAGGLTLWGSETKLIVAEPARGDARLGFGSALR